MRCLGGEKLMSKDQAIGGVILVVCVIVALGYIGLLFLYDPYISSLINLGSAANVHFWTIAIPVAVAFVAILGIGAWIGFTMATTPPPKPIEEITLEPKEEKT
jgi:Na+-driven multidrug efflux pump